MAKEVSFVYAVHDEEYADTIGVELASVTKQESAVALEWASMSTDVSKVDFATKLVNSHLSGIVGAKSADEAYHHLAALGNFYGRLMRPLVGSQVSVHLVDVYQHQDLAMRSYRFNNYELYSTLNTVVSGRMSLAQRREIITELAAKSDEISSARDEIVIGQLHEIASSHDAISVFQGLGHQAVADRLKEDGFDTAKKFVPELISWSGTEEVSDKDRETQLYKLQQGIKDGKSEDEIEDLANRTLLAEYIIAYLLNNAVWRSQETNAYAAMIAASRIVGALDNDRAAAKAKAAVKCSNDGQPLAKVIKPLLPKHSIKVTV